MANLRKLKKEIRYVCGDLAAECLIAKNFYKDVDKAKLNDAIRKIASLQGRALSTVSFAFDKLPSDFESGREYLKARAAYFRKAYKSFRDKFYDHVKEIVHDMNGALPKAAREAAAEA